MRGPKEDFAGRTSQQGEQASSSYRPYAMSDVWEASRAKRFSVISTFAGGGGSSLGYRLAGGNVLAASEFVPEAVRTYKSNFPNVLVDSRDIRELLANDGLLKLLNEVGLQPGGLDLLDGSPPCSEFSVAGNGIAETDSLKAYSDVMQRNIATLPFDFVRVAAVARPKVVIMENVPGLSHRKSRHILDSVVRSLRFAHGFEGKQAYFVTWKILLASDFGVGQGRRRLFIVGVRRDVGQKIGICDDGAVQRVYPDGVTSPTTVRAALAGLEQGFSEVFPWLRAAMTSQLGAKIRMLPKSPERVITPQDIDPFEKNNFTLKRSSWDLPSPTLVVYGQQPDGRTGVLHPALDRKFTLPELKRLTSLPDDFILTGTLAQAAERICRMVPPLLTKALATSIHERVLCPYKERIK